MSDVMMWLDHAICLTCGAMRADELHVFRANNGMAAGIYPYPVLVPARYARHLAELALCRSCNKGASFQLALRPMGES